MPLENGDDVAEIPAIPAKKSTTQQKKASETVNGKSNFFFIKMIKTNNDIYSLPTSRLPEGGR